MSQTKRYRQWGRKLLLLFSFALERFPFAIMTEIPAECPDASNWRTHFDFSSWPCFSQRFSSAIRLPEWIGASGYCGHPPRRRCPFARSTRFLLWFKAASLSLSVSRSPARRVSALFFLFMKRHFRSRSLFSRFIMQEASAEMSIHASAALAAPGLIYISLFLCSVRLRNRKPPPPVKAGPNKNILIKKTKKNCIKIEKKNAEPSSSQRRLLCSVAPKNSTACYCSIFVIIFFFLKSFLEKMSLSGSWTPGDPLRSTARQNAKRFEKLWKATPSLHRNFALIQLHSSWIFFF